MMDTCIENNMATSRDMYTERNIEILFVNLSLRWTFSLPDDIFEDMSFKTDPSSEQKSPRSPRSRLQSFDLSTDDQDDRDSWRSSLDRRSTDSNSYRIESFKEHCKMLTEMYLNSFVTGENQATCRKMVSCGVGDWKSG